MSQEPQVPYVHWTASRIAIPGYPDGGADRWPVHVLLDFNRRPFRRLRIKDVSMTFVCLVAGKCSGNDLPHQYELRGVRGDTDLSTVQARCDFCDDARSLTDKQVQAVEDLLPDAVERYIEHCKEIKAEVVAGMQRFAESLRAKK